MPIEAPGARPDRVPLTRELVIRTAMAIADGGGLDALSMRTLGRQLGVAPMALYYHFKNKNELLDGLVDRVFAEIEVPDADGAWTTAMRRRAISVRRALGRHPWAIGLMESRRNPGPANLRHHDLVIARLLEGGFDMAGAARAYSLLDSYIYGFALTKTSLPFESADEAADVARGILQPFAAETYPHLAAFIAEHAARPGYEYEEEFEPGLDLILRGLQKDVTDAGTPVSE